MPSRREILDRGAHACIGAAAFATFGSGGGGATPDEKAAPQRYLLIGLCGSENPTRANFPFAWAAALREAGHDVRIELAGDATVLMRTAVANSVTPVGWPPLREALAKVFDLKITVYV